MVKFGGFHFEEYLIVNLENQTGGQTRSGKPVVDTHQGYFEDVGRQPLYWGIHGLALPRLTDIEVV